MKKDQRMDALVEIHRVLYRGKEDHMGETVPWREQGPEVRRVVERWFETDCCELHQHLKVLWWSDVDGQHTTTRWSDYRLDKPS